jgi:hypothetical protein
LATDAIFFFYGGSYQIIDFFTIAVSVNNFSYGFDDPKHLMSKYVVTLAVDVWKGITLGMNFGLTRIRYDNQGVVNKDIVGLSTLPEIDLGTYKKFDFRKLFILNHSLSLGTSISNVLNTKIEFNTDWDSRNTLPIIFRIGMSYDLSHPYDLQVTDEIWSFLIQTEYRDVLNSDQMKSFKMGFEIGLFKIALIRMGYFYEQMRGWGLNSLDAIEDFTYGFGIILPLNTITKMVYFPNVEFDYTSLEQPTHIDNYSDWDNFKSFNINLKWLF